ncbi:MAG: PAS domain S-box protein [Oscillatoriales cyanobacterium C42_A2020_001]|nr:PAS domain S-box protein [Leptolyngbyaceae cyanobacterium C42_A2020_001]
MGEREQRLSIQNQAQDSTLSPAEAIDLFNLSPGLLGVLTQDGTFQQVNPAFERLLGQSAEELRDRRLLEFIHPTDQASFNAALTSLKTEANSLQIETGCCGADGTCQWITWMLASSRNSQSIYVTGQTLRDRAWSQVEQPTPHMTDRTVQLEHENRLRQVIEQMPVLMNATNEQGAFVLWNQECERVTGYSAAEVLGSSDIMKRLYPDEEYLQQKLKAWETQTNNYRNWEWTLTAKDGTRKTIAWSNISALCPIAGWAGWGIGVDVTERRQIETALRHQKERYRYIFEATGVSLWEEDFSAIKIEIDRLKSQGIQDFRQYCATHPDFVQWALQAVNIVNVNEMTMQLFEAHDKTELLESLHSIFLPETLGAFVEELVAIAEGRTFIQTETVLQTLQGNRIDVLFTVTFPISTESFDCVLVSITDITDRKQAEEALKDALQKLTFHVENSPLGVIEWNSEFRIARWSDEAERIFGWSAEDVIGKRFDEWQFIFGDDVSQVEAIVSQLSAGTVRRTASSNRNYTKDGGIVYCTWYNSTLLDESGKLVSVLSLAQDITQQMQLEEEHDRLLKQEQSARQQAEQANRIKDEFLAVLSHELRTPLNPILGWAKLLQTGKTSPEKLQAGLSTIERNAKLQAQLIDDLLDISRIIRGKLTLNLTPLSLSGSITAAIETVRLSAEAKAIQIETLLEPDVGTMLGDSGRLQQVVWNLLSNAIKFTPEGGRVQVRLERVESKQVGEQMSEPTDETLPTYPLASSYAQITVTDNGKGISPEFLPHVFELFRQQDSSTTRQFGGLGLGLAIVRQVVEAHGGSVAVDSRGLGQGATFTVRLPLVVASARTAHREHTNSAGDFSGIRILVVDDEPDSLALVAVLLEQEGGTVTAVSSGQAVLAALGNASFDLLISDIGMPEMDGYELIRQVRSRPAWQGGGIPAIALTAYVGETDQQTALAAGYQEHLTKPLDPDALNAAIARLCSLNP